MTIKRDSRARVQDTESARALGKLNLGITKRKSMLRACFEYVGSDIAKDLDEKIPKHLDINTVLCMAKLSKIAYRKNNTHQIVECPKCHKDVSIPIFDDTSIAREKNSIAALAHLFDRLAPKLASLQVNVDVQQEAEKTSDIFFNSIVRFVAPEKREECMKYLKEQLEALDARRES
jgi:hypothetical protein